MEENERKRKRKSKEKMKSGSKKTKPDIQTSKLPDEGSQDHGRMYTVSVALPGSIISNAQNLQLKTYLVGQIARALAVFNVDEIVVFDESTPSMNDRHNPNVFLCKLLQYLDTPQYLRKSLFPMQDDLKFAGLLNPIDAPHHMRMDEDSQFREGVALDLPHKKSPRGGKGSFVNCGTAKKVLVDRIIEPLTRITVKLDNNTKLGKYMTGSVVPPSEPRTTTGTYWGYSVRMAERFSDVFTKSPYKGGYDLIIGTSERGRSVDSLESIPVFRHLLIVFGGLNGLEYSMEVDESLRLTDVTLLFHYYLNTCPKQGSRTIRTEEALLVTLSSLRPLIESYGFKESS